VESKCQSYGGVLDSQELHDEVFRQAGEYTVAISAVC